MTHIPNNEACDVVNKVAEIITVNYTVNSQLRHSQRGGNEVVKMTALGKSAEDKAIQRDCP